ncbi:MAG: hypothetical protein V1834_00245 [Candidatus Micrarchaeota archaeon]
MKTKLFVIALLLFSVYVNAALFSCGDFEKTSTGRFEFGASETGTRTLCMRPGDRIVLGRLEGFETAIVLSQISPVYLTYAEDAPQEMKALFSIFQGTDNRAEDFAENGVSIKVLAPYGGNAPPAIESVKKQSDTDETLFEFGNRLSVGIREMYLHKSFSIAVYNIGREDGSDIQHVKVRIVKHPFTSPETIRTVPPAQLVSESPLVPAYSGPLLLERQISDSRFAETSAVTGETNIIVFPEKIPVAQAGDSLFTLLVFEANTDATRDYTLTNNAGEARVAVLETSVNSGNVRVSSCAGDNYGENNPGPGYYSSTGYTISTRPYGQDVFGSSPIWGNGRNGVLICNLGERFNNVIAIFNEGTVYGGYWNIPWEIVALHVLTDVDSNDVQYPVPVPEIYDRLLDTLFGGNEGGTRPPTTNNYGVGAGDPWTESFCLNANSLGHGEAYVEKVPCPTRADDDGSVTVSLALNHYVDSDGDPDNNGPASVLRGDALNLWLDGINYRFDNFQMRRSRGDYGIDPFGVVDAIAGSEFHFRVLVYQASSGSFYPKDCSKPWTIDPKRAYWGFNKDELPTTLPGTVGPTEECDIAGLTMRLITFDTDETLHRPDGTVNTEALGYYHTGYMILEISR